MTGLLVLSGCDGAGNPVEDNNLSEPVKDGVAPTLTIVEVQPNGNVEAGDSVLIDFVASEAIMRPVVYINNVQAEVTGKITEWSAVRDITDSEPLGEVTFSIVYQDISGELGQAVTATTDGSFACVGVPGVDCPLTDDLGPLEGNWKLEFAGVGPNAGDTSWFNISDTGPDGPRACWFDDIYQFGGDGSFRNIQGDESWVEPWQGTSTEEACGTPVAPHDGSNNAVFEYVPADAEADTLGTVKLTGLGAYLGLPKVVNGAELTDPANAPESVTYEIVSLIGDNLTVRINVGGGWWEFRLTRLTNSPIVGKWKLNFAGVGPNEGDTSWFNITDTGPDGPRACWFDDIYLFADDGSFQNFQDGLSWVEPWQGTSAEEACGTPVAPHDGSSAGAWYYDSAAETPTLRLDGIGSFLGLPKVVNGAELADPANAPASVTYNVVDLVGDSLKVRIDVGGGWWEFEFERVADTADLKGNWKLEFAGVGPDAGDTSWFNISDTGPDGPRACWFDDIYQFGRDGSFRNIQGDESWVEPWQGTSVEEACGTPVAPHDGSNNAVFEYVPADAEADTLGTVKLTGLGAYLGLPKVVNGAELTDPANAPESVTYEIVSLIGDSLTVRINVGGGWWQYRLTRLSNSPMVGNWKLNFAGVGPNEGDTSWFNITDTGPDGPRACWFDDIYHVAADGSFQNFQDGLSWVEPWQGTSAEEACGTPVAPHDGSSAGAWYFDDAAETRTLRLDGIGSFIGLPKVVNGAELADPANAPASVTYDVVDIIGGSLTIRINVGGGWWEFDLIKDE